MQLAGLILICAVAPVVTVMAESLETILLAWAASLLAASKLRAETRSRNPSLDASVQQTLLHKLNVKWQSQQTTGIFSFLCLAAAFSTLAALGGSFSLDVIRTTLQESYHPERLDLLVGEGSVLGIASIVLIFAGIAAAFGLFPMHGAGQNAFESSPAGIAGATAVLQRFQAAAILWKTVLTSMPGFEPATQLMCVVFGSCSCLAGAILACRSEALRNLAGNLWTTWGGITIVSLAMGMSAQNSTNSLSVWQLPTGFELAALALASSSVAIGFLLAAERWLRAPKRSIDFAEDVTGLGHQHGLIAFAMSCSLLTLSAIPPLPGFWCAAFQTGNAFLPGVASPDGPAFVPNYSVLAAAILMLISLLIVSARSVHFLSLMFHHEPIRRFTIAHSKVATVVSLSVSGLLVWTGLKAGTVLAWLHQLPL